MSSYANYTATLNVVPCTPGGTGSAGMAVCRPTGSAGWLPATTANLASADIGGIALDDFTAGGPQFRVCSSGLVPSDIVGTLSGSGDFVNVQADATLVRSSTSGNTTVGTYLPNGDVNVNLSIQTSPTVAAISDGYVDISSYGLSNAGIAAADAVAQASSPPKTLLWREAITLTASITIASPVKVNGGSVTAGSAYTLTIGHSLECGRVQFVTSTNVTLAFANGHKQVELFPEWWGADPTGYLCNGVTVAAGLTLASGDATVGGSGFTSSHVGKICCAFEQTGSDAFRSTVASVTSSSLLELAANSTADITTANGSQVWIGTDSYAALRAAIVASRGEIYVSLTPDGEYGVATQLDPRPSANGLKMRGNGAWIRWCGTAGTGKVFSADDGLDTNGGARTGCHITDLNVSACNLVNDAIYMANETYPKRGRGMAGTWRNVRAMHALRYGHYHHGAQVTVFDACYAQFFGSVGWTAIACNSAALRDCRSSNPHTASADAIVVDSYPQSGGGGGGDSYGGGDVVATNFIAEVVTGRGIVVLDTGGSSGSVVEFAGGHLEGIQEDGIYVDRENTIIRGLSVTGPGGTTYYPFRVTANAHGTRIQDLSVGTYGTNQLGGIVDTGATNIIVESNYVPSTNSRADPSVADIWPGKLHLRHAAGDVYAQGKLFVGSSTYTPSTTLDDAFMLHGHARLRHGGLQMHAGSVLSPYGGIGKGTNYMLRSEEFDNASWTKSSCTVTANAALGPIAGTVADELAFSSASGFIRQEYAYGSSLADLNWTAGIWLRTSSGTASINIAQSVGSAATISSTTWTITTEWQFIRTTGSSGNTGTTYRFQIGPTTGTPTVYAWGACAQLVEDYAELAGGIDYAKTISTARTIKSSGPVFNAPPVPPGGTTVGATGASTDLTITDSRITATSNIDLYATSAAGLTMLASGYYHMTRAAGSVVLRFGVAAAGGETFEYVIKERWSA